MINLFQHQQQALDETEEKNRVAYYLDMGLGKTFVGSEKNDEAEQAEQSGGVPMFKGSRLD